MRASISSLVVAGALALGAVAIGGPILTARPAPPADGFSHQLLEADRQMTQEMGAVAGPGMATQMVSFGMLKRSADPAYVRALEEHTYQFNRMLGSVP